ncbi:MAG: type II secretion system protein [Rhodoferax sp.]|uniref:type II secretion system protein n=1 Tax=Rhodoferax sp. TaxID=50421 RepID=UPI0026357EF0|nr:type II secretion system protein [Rhodoferax sp.]MDD5333143.1 type II secretion system protein [Rhodoferax sp.]
MKSSQRGFSLMESSIALIVLGLLTTAAVAYLRLAGQQKVATVEHDLQRRAQQAVYGFVHANFRLPCPAADTSGIESCHVNGGDHSVGMLPWRTLQLPDATASTLKYGVYRVANANGWQDTDLAVSRDRMRPLVAIGITPVATESLLGNRNLLDFCYGATLAAQAGTSATALAVKDGTTATRRPMAFVIAAPGLLDADGDGDRFDALNHGASDVTPTFEAGNRSRSDLYDDRVSAIGFDTLFTQMNCAQALSVIDHSHFNAALSASVMERALSDYHYQLQVQAVLAGAGVASATAGTAGATAGLAIAVTTLVNATTFTVITVGTQAGLIAAAAVSVVANTTTVLASIGTLTTSILVTVEAAQRVATGAEMAASSATLSTAINANARNADALGF